MLRPYNEAEHYEFYHMVSTSHGWPPLPLHLLPDTGFVSYIGDRPASIVFVYQTIGTQWGVMEWLFVDNSFNKGERNTAITECIEGATGFAKMNNLTLFTSCKGAKLMHRYQQAGFQKTDEGMTNFIFRG